MGQKEDAHIKQICFLYMVLLVNNPPPQNTGNKETFLSREKIISQALCSERSLFSRHGKYEGKTLLCPKMSSQREKIKYTNIC